MNVYLDKLLSSELLFGRAEVVVGRPRARKLEVVDGEVILQELKVCHSALVYGNAIEAKRLVQKLIGSSDDLIALVGCEGLQEGHRQIAMKGLGESSCENIERLGFVPDLIVAKCKSLREACELVKWTDLGTRLICLVDPRRSEHNDWVITKGFELQAFCCDDGSVIVDRKA
jgi:hypothetical protein